MMTSDLIAFLRARLDEDEAAARDSYYEGQRWITEEEGVYRWPDDELVQSADRKADARHIARHDPARALREVEAKRAILDQLGTDLSYRPPVPPGHQRAWAIASLIAEKMAAVYSDHPDYRKDWA